MKKQFMLGALMLMGIISSLLAFIAQNLTAFYSFDASRPPGQKCFTATAFTRDILRADDPTPITLYLKSAADGNSCITPFTAYAKLISRYQKIKEIRCHFCE
jgi:hypothetical protein